MEVALLSPSWSLSGSPVLLEVSELQHATPPAPAAAAAPWYIQPAGLHRKSHRVSFNGNPPFYLRRVHRLVFVLVRASVQGTERGRRRWV